MRHCSVSACETFVPGPMIASAPPICPKSALSLLPLIRPPTTFPTTRIRDEKLDAFGVPGHHPRDGVMSDEGEAARKARKLRASRDRWKLRSAEKQKQIRQLRVTN